MSILPATDTASLEAFITYAYGEGREDPNCVQVINQLRSSEDRWSIGIRLFFDTRGPQVRHFGLSLVRDYLHAANRSGGGSEDALQHTRETIFMFVRNSIEQSVGQNVWPFEVYIVNYLVSIITLCIKIDCPERWPTAFSDLLVLGSGEGNINGAGFVVGVLTEMDVEIVEFNNERSQREILHNTVIKDYIRDGNIAQELSIFLCSTAINSRQAGLIELSKQALNAFAQMIGWIDVNLVIKCALPSIYQCMNDAYIGGAACSCIFELVKKGMDPLQKVQLVNDIELIQIILSVNIKDNEDGDDTEDGNSVAEELGPIVDILVQELLGVWISCEDQMHKTAASLASTMLAANGCIMQAATTCLTEISLTSADMLRVLMPQLLRIFGHSDVDVSSTVTDSVNKIIALLKSQNQKLDSLRTVKDIIPRIFIAEEFLNDLLLNIYKQMQFPSDFAFDPDDEDDAVIIEAKRAVRKLFINITRVRPHESLQLITAACASLPQPLSVAPYCQIEAVLRLVLSFSEAGAGSGGMLHDGVFPSLLNALHESDVAMHKHSQVLIVYYEVCARYAHLLKENHLVSKIASNMLGTTGLRHSSSQVRHRTAYLFLKFSEGLDEKIIILLDCVSGFSDLILSDVSGGKHDNETLLNESAELYLLEAIGLMTSVRQSGNDTVKRHQQTLFVEMITHLRKQVHDLCSHPNSTEFQEEFAVIMAHKASSFAALVKGHNLKNHAHETPILLATANDMATAINMFAIHPSVRGRGVIFMHRMITSIGKEALGPIQSVLPALINYSDSKDTDVVVQLLNQCMIEFEDQMLDVIDLMFVTIFEKYKALYGNMERNFLSPDKDQLQVGDGPQFDTERASMMKQFLMFVQHVVHYDCQAALSISQRGNSHVIKSVLQIVTDSLKGEISSEFASQTDWKVNLAVGIPLRKYAVCIITDLIKEWSNGATGIGPNSLSRGPVPQELSIAFARTLFDDLIPVCLKICSSQQDASPASSGSLDLKDAQTLSLVQDIGSLLWTVANVRGTDEIVSFLQQFATQSLGWSDDLTTRIINELNQRGNLGTFKDNFKKIVKSQLKTSKQMSV